MSPKTTVAEDLRFVRDLDQEPAELQAVLKGLTEADDAAIAELYDPERETYFTA